MAAPLPATLRFDLTAPAVSLQASWLEAASEFAALGEFQHGSGLTPDGEAPRFGGTAWRPAELADPERFAAFVAHLRGLDREDVVRPLGMVPDTKLWITSGETYLGAVSVRHELNDFLLAVGGHIGYSVRPSARRRGLATGALRRSLDVARGLGLARVLVTCVEDNEGSRRTIEGAGGELEDVRDGMRRYWITL